jgi:hypothetical protein
MAQRSGTPGRAPGNAVPRLWKVTMGILVACLIASMVIGTIKLISL